MAKYLKKQNTFNYFSQQMLHNYYSKQYLKRERKCEWMLPKKICFQTQYEFCKLHINVHIHRFKLLLFSYTNLLFEHCYICIRIYVRDIRYDCLHYYRYQNCIIDQCSTLHFCEVKLYQYYRMALVMHGYFPCK
jgi:hypothetical protein